jgi:energy-coupling factor transporter ATP-binding protein EcfA2
MRPLEIRHLSFAYEDGTVALRGVSLSLDKGEKVAVVGPNGAGKSTLLHLIAGFRMPFEGQVLLEGLILAESNADDLRKKVGLLFQDPDDQVFMPTVEEDIAFGPRNLGLEDIEGRVLRSLRSTGIEGLAKRKPHNLSYGMKKRVAIAGILAMEPSILLLDEPTSGLDPRARTELIGLLKGMDRTMLIATHDIEAAAEIADKALVLNVDVVMEGTMRELVMAKDVLARTGLEMPPVSKLFAVLEAMGYGVENLPISIDEAAAELTKVIDNEGRHIHAHIHEHDHAAGEAAREHAHSHQEKAKSDKE